MEYKDVINPTELLEFMDENIKYGFVDRENKIHKPSDSFDKECRKNWRLSSPERLIEKGYGHCYDQVELERDWFTKNGYNVKTFFSIFELDYDNPYTTHTFLVYEDNNKFYLFEHADYENRGIWEFSSYNEAVKAQIKRSVTLNRKNNNLKDDELSSLCVYEYNKPKYNISMNRFIDDVIYNRTNTNTK